MKGRKVGTIFANNDGEGFIVWDEHFIEKACCDTVYGVDVFSELLVELKDEFEGVIDSQAEEVAARQASKKSCDV